MLEPTENPDSVGLTTPWLSEDDQDVLWSFMEAAPVALLAAGDDREIVRANDLWCRLTGYSPADLEKLRIDDVLTPESRSRAEMGWRDVMSLGLATARLVIASPDGSRVPVRAGGFANI